MHCCWLSSWRLAFKREGGVASFKVMDTCSWIKLVCCNWQYNISYPNVYNNQPLQRTFVYSSNFVTVHSPVRMGALLLSGVWVQTSMSVGSPCCTQNAVYQHFIYLYRWRTPHAWTVFAKIFVHHSLLVKLLGTHFRVSSSLSATAALFYFEIRLHVALQWVALALIDSI